MKSLDMNLLNYKEDKSSTSKELDAVLTYQDKLKPQCESKVYRRFFTQASLYIGSFNTGVSTWGAHAT